MAESYMSSIGKGAITIDSFLGINTLPSCGANEFKKMQNMTTDYYPVMSTRPKRYKTKIPISGTEYSVTATPITKCAAFPKGKAGAFTLFYSFTDAQVKKLSSSRTILCYLKRKGEDKYHKCYGYAVTKDTLYIRFGNYTEYETMKNALKLKTTTTGGVGGEIENEEDYLEAKFITAPIQSNIAFQDGYFYYVRDTSLVRRRPDEEEEEKLISNVFEGECRVNLSGTAVVVSPQMGVYYFSTGLIRAEGYDMPIFYDDVTVECPVQDRPSYKLVIRNPSKQDEKSVKDFVFITKDGTKYNQNMVYNSEINDYVHELCLYNGQNDEHNFESTSIEIVPGYINSDLDEKRKEFAEKCLYYTSKDGKKFKGGLREDVFSKTEPIGYIDGFSPELGFNPKFSILYNNRMFACNAGGDCVHSSVIGKPYDFTTLEDGEASADWIEVVSAGQFTGIAAFGGNVYYFKEHCVHKLYGSSPTDWQLVMLPINGVEEGADKSVAVENDVCIYKSTDGFYLFDGFTATKISGKLGRNTVLPDECEKSLRYIEYSSCIFKGKYYCSAYDRIEKKYTLYTYDINTGLWCAEELNSDSGFTNLMRTNRDVYGVKVEEDRINLVSLSSGGEFSDEQYETGFEWSVESGDMTLGYANNKYISKIQIRAQGEAGTKIYVKVVADRKENKSAEFEFSPDTLDSFSYSPKPIRCDNFRMLLSGTGQAKIYSITLTVSEGSEIR